ncbi:MAG: hypothetical protein DMG05_15815 [Acidobacteria bacterium]|nr:MAG: hypothetical protein DMG05_15815 [Acidobacteriota bacterium]
MAGGNVLRLPLRCYVQLPDKQEIDRTFGGRLRGPRNPLSFFHQPGEDAWAAPIYNLIGATIPGYDVLPEPLRGKIKANGKTYDWSVWADWLEPKGGTLVLAHYTDQFYAGRVAATSHKLARAR